MFVTMTTFCAPAKYSTHSTCMLLPHLKWCRMPLRARPSAQLVVKFSTLTSGYERVHWRTQLSKIFSLLVCCRLDMMSFMMSFTYMNMEKHINVGEFKKWDKTCNFAYFDSVSLLGFTLLFRNLTWFAFFWECMVFVNMEKWIGQMSLLIPGGHDR